MDNAISHAAFFELYKKGKAEVPGFDVVEFFNGWIFDDDGAKLVKGRIEVNPRGFSQVDKVTDVRVDGVPIKEIPGITGNQSAVTDLQWGKPEDDPRLRSTVQMGIPLILQHLR